MKRMISFMMALALILSLGVTAFAAGGTGAGSITITNATVGEVYNVYKIFDATYNDKNEVTYTIKTTDKFFDEMFGANGTAANYFVYHADTGVVTRSVNADGNPIKTDAELMTYLASLIADATPDKYLTADSATVLFDDLDTGYYVIDRDGVVDKDGNPVASAVTVTTTKPDANVIDKNQLPGGDIDKKADKDADNNDAFTVNVGDVINWDVTFTATNYDGDEKVLFYTIKDSLTPADWAAINTDSIKVYVDINGNGFEDDAELVKGTDWTLEKDTASAFEIKIPWATVDAGKFVEFKYPATAKVKITYSATVLDAAASNDPTDKEDVLKNTAEVDWNNKTGHKDETETEVYNLGFTKVDGTDSTKTLPGAVFELYSDKACTKPIFVKTNGTDGVYIVDKDATPENGSNSVITPANGQVVIQGLAEGTYYLKETVAPAGYNKLNEVKEVEVNKDAADALTFGEGESAVTYKLNNAELNIVNNSGVELPSTGGQGTMLMITIGTMMAIAFAVLLITQKKMSVYED